MFEHLTHANLLFLALAGMAFVIFGLTLAYADARGKRP